MKAPHRAAWALTVIHAMHMHELRIVCNACIYSMPQQNYPNTLTELMVSQNAISTHQCSKIWNPCSSYSGSHRIHSLRICTSFHPSGMALLVLHVHELCCQFLYRLVTCIHQLQHDSMIYV